MKGRSVNYSWSWSPFCLLSLPPSPPFMLLQTTSLDFSCGRTLRGKQSFAYLAVLILALIPKESVAVPLDWPLVQYSTIGKLRSIFNSIGRSGDWSGLSPGNPVAHPSAKTYLASISEEQAKARVTPREALPSFLVKFIKLHNYLRNRTFLPSIPPLERYLVSLIWLSSVWISTLVIGHVTAVVFILNSFSSFLENMAYCFTTSLGKRSEEITPMFSLLKHAPMRV